jgi:hypothetical protein
MGTLIKGVAVKIMIEESNPEPKNRGSMEID